jgi:hypothetical protein
MLRQKHLRAARPMENESETPAGRQADVNFTLPSRFALFFITSVSRELHSS